VKHGLFKKLKNIDNNNLFFKIPKIQVICASNKSLYNLLLQDGRTIHQAPFGGVFLPGAKTFASRTASEIIDRELALEIAMLVYT